MACREQPTLARASNERVTFISYFAFPSPILRPRSAANQTKQTPKTDQRPISAIAFALGLRCDKQKTRMRDIHTCVCLCANQSVRPRVCSNQAPPRSYPLYANRPDDVAAGLCLFFFLASFSHLRDSSLCICIGLSERRLLPHFRALCLSRFQFCQSLLSLRRAGCNSTFSLAKKKRIG